MGSRIRPSTNRKKKEMVSHRKTGSKSRLSKGGGNVGGGGNKKKGEIENITTNEDDHPYGLGTVVVVNLGEGEKFANVLERTQIATENEEPDPACRYMHALYIFICKCSDVLYNWTAVVLGLGLAACVHIMTCVCMAKVMIVTLPSHSVSIDGSTMST